MKRIISLIFILLIILPLIPVSADYTPQFSYEAKILYDMGLFKGTDAGFDLDKKCDRVQAAALFIRLMGKELEALSNPKKHPFLDVPQWANAYVGQMYYDGYTKGVSAFEYGVGDMTANQFATLCLRALGYSESVSDWREFKYDNALEKTLELNIIKQNEYDIIKSSNLFYRDYAVKLAYNSLFEPGRDKQSDILINKLIEMGAINADDIKNNDTSNWDNIIELDSAEDVYALSRILAPEAVKTNFINVDFSYNIMDDFACFDIPVSITEESDKIRYLQTASYKLTDDINLLFRGANGKDFFAGIGSTDYPFEGNFDGGNHIVTLSSTTTYISPNGYYNNGIGLFGTTQEANIVDTNVKIGNNIIINRSSHDVLYLGGIAGCSISTKFRNCSTKMSGTNLGVDYTLATYYSKPYIGGLVGSASFSIFTDCVVEMENASIYAKSATNTKYAVYAQQSVGGLLGFSGAGSNNTTNIGRLGTQLYNCNFISRNDNQQDVIASYIDVGQEIVAGGIVGAAFNNLVVKNCTVEITKGNIIANKTGTDTSATYGTNAGGIIGRLEHTGELINCSVKGNYLNIISRSPEEPSNAGGVVGINMGPYHRKIVSINNCSFDGNGTSNILVEVKNSDTENEINCVGGIVGANHYSIYDCTVKDVIISNKSVDVNKSYSAGVVGCWNATSGLFSSGTYFTPDTPEILNCTTSGITFDNSPNVIVGEIYAHKK